MSDVLLHYEQLCARIDQKFTEIRAQHQSEFACQRGCHSCCKPGLTVNALEKKSLQEFFLAYPALQQEARELELSDPFRGTRCRFLRASGDCLVYEARPIVCRTHGAPLQARSPDADETVLRDVCPLNFKNLDITTLPPEQVMNLDTVNTLLAVLTKIGFPGNESRTLLSVDTLLESQ